MEDKQLEIINKSALLFLKNGIKSVTMDDLAKELGVSKKTIYKYFDDKNDLVTKIVEIKTSLDRQACKEARCDSENAIDALFKISEFVSEMMQNVHSSVFFDLQKYHRDAWEVMEEHKLNFVKSQIKENIERGQEEGLYIPTLNSEVISSIYISTMNGLFDGFTFDLSKFQFKTIFDEIIYFQIRGIANDRGLKYLNNRIKKQKDRK
ncbi:MAG: TetR/AcrR family transcriptional regulator [Brumimicrobium sp.]